VLPRHITEQLGASDPPAPTEARPYPFGHAGNLEGALQGKAVARYALYAFALFKIYRADEFWTGRIPTFFVVAATCIAYELCVAALRHVDLQRVETRSGGDRFRARWTFLSSLIFLAGFGIGGIAIGEPFLSIVGIVPVFVGFLAARAGLDTLFPSKVYLDDEPVE
jgi:hypothetical protein